MAAKRKPRVPRLDPTRLELLMPPDRVSPNTPLAPPFGVVASAVQPAQHLALKGTRHQQALGYLSILCYPPKPGERAWRQQNFIDAASSALAHAQPPEHKPDWHRLAHREDRVDQSMIGAAHKFATAMVAAWFCYTLIDRRDRSDPEWARLARRTKATIPQFAAGRAAELLRGKVSERFVRDVVEPRLPFVHLALPIWLASLPEPIRRRWDDRYPEMLMRGAPAAFVDLLASDAWVYSALDAAEHWRQALGEWPWFVPVRAVEWQP